MWACHRPERTRRGSLKCFHFDGGGNPAAGSETGKAKQFADRIAGLARERLAAAEGIAEFADSCHQPQKAIAPSAARTILRRLISVIAVPEALRENARSPAIGMVARRAYQVERIGTENDATWPVRVSPPHAPEPGDRAV